MPEPSPDFRTWLYETIRDTLRAPEPSVRVQVGVLTYQQTVLYDAIVARVRSLADGLAESVKLQSHYAGLLNQYDGGRRIVFKNADEWLAWLAMSSEERVADARRRDREEAPRAD